jgi:fermentation-respiration switch protein FrsA (DUF1100 family)
MLTAAIILIGLYFLIGAAAYFYSDSIIFQPQAIDFSDKSYIYKLVTPSGEKIHAKFFENQEAEFTILFSHGNAEDIFTSTPFFEELSRAGFNVFAYDYRGYGISEGRPSEKNAYLDIETAYNFLVNEKRIAPEKIILHGRSLGGAVAIDLASRRKCGGMIVESTFVSAFRVMTGVPILPFDKFESLKKIGSVNCPVLVIHGTSDTLIPFWHGEKLFAAANGPKWLYAVENAGHNDLAAVSGVRYFAEIIDFSKKLAQP